MGAVMTSQDGGGVRVGVWGRLSPIPPPPLLLPPHTHLVVAAVGKVAVLDDLLAVLLQDGGGVWVSVEIVGVCGRLA